MKKSKLFLTGILGILLVFGLVLTGCPTDDGDRTTTPSAPTGVTATAQSASSILVSWNAVPDADSYKVYYGTSTSSIDSLAGTVTSASYTHTGLTAGTTYYYRVKAVNSAGESDYSSYQSAATSAPGGNEDDTGGNKDNTGGNEDDTGGTTVPSTPIGVTATVQSASSISVSWSAVSGATSYKVYYEIGSSTTKNLASGTVTGTSYTHTGLTAGTTYYYYIKAVNSAGESGYSSYASATTSSSSSGGGNITYTVSTTGSPTTTALSFSFSSSVSGLTASNITITSGTGAATKGTLTGSGTSWSLGITTSTAGTISVSISKSGISSNSQTVTLSKSGGGGTETILQPESFTVSRLSSGVTALLSYSTSQKSTADTYTYILYEDGDPVFMYTDAPNQQTDGFGTIGLTITSGSSYRVALVDQTLLNLPGTYRIKVEVRKSGLTSYFTSEKSVIIPD
jgi:fibronectin type 3 domain-containing protein